MNTFDTRKHVPIKNHKKDSGFYLCYESEGVDRAILRCWYGKNGDVFFYPNMSDYQVTYDDKEGNSIINSASELKHQRITVHQSGYVVGPDKHDREYGLKYEQLKTSIKSSPKGVRLSIHKLAHPGLYSEITDKTKRKGDWVRFRVKDSGNQPVISIDAYPIFHDSDVENIQENNNYICGFFTKSFEQGYKILIMFNLTEETPETDMYTHTVHVPVKI